MNRTRTISLPRLSKCEGDVAAALEALQRRIEAGEEYPDAQWRVVCEYRVCPQALQDAYDNEH